MFYQPKIIDLRTASKKEEPLRQLARLMRHDNKSVVVVPAILQDADHTAASIVFALYLPWEPHKLFLHEGLQFTDIQEIAPPVDGNAEFMARFLSVAVHGLSSHRFDSLILLYDEASGFRPNPDQTASAEKQLRESIGASLILRKTEGLLSWFLVSLALSNLKMFQSFRKVKGESDDFVKRVNHARDYTLDEWIKLCRTYGFNPFTTFNIVTSAKQNQT